MMTDVCLLSHVQPAVQPAAHMIHSNQHTSRSRLGNSRTLGRQHVLRLPWVWCVTLAALLGSLLVCNLVMPTGRWQHLARCRRQLHGGM